MYKSYAPLTSSVSLFLPDRINVVHDMTTREKMDQVKREFVQMVSHDLKMPLTSLKMTLSMLLDGTYGELTVTGKPRIECASYDLTRLINLVNELLEFERMESGKMELYLEPSAVHELVRQSVESLRSLAEKHQIQLEIESGHQDLVADANRLVQVLVNLLGNAIKFSPRGSTIRIETKVLAHEVEFRIIDQGKGVPLSQQERLFDRFEQVTIDDARVRGGHGLGLAICKSIVEAHGGSIGVEGGSGQGSTFWFRIPLSHVADFQSVP